jgi:hypothetical protein
MRSKWRMVRGILELNGPAVLAKALAERSSADPNLGGGARIGASCRSTTWTWRAREVAEVALTDKHAMREARLQSQIDQARLELTMTTRDSRHWRERSQAIRALLAKDDAGGHPREILIKIALDFEAYSALRETSKSTR